VNLLAGLGDSVCLFISEVRRPGVSVETVWANKTTTTKSWLPSGSTAAHWWRGVSKNALSKRYRIKKETRI